MSDYTILASPRISFATFERTLHDADSPAYPLAAACWANIVACGVDPALALAQFGHESGYGVVGIATSHRNWGNLRTSTSGVFPTADGFVVYPSWSAGALDYAELVAGPLYGRSADHATALTMPFRYAPEADGNDPAAYGADLVARITALIAADGGQEAETVTTITLTLFAGPRSVTYPAGTRRFTAEGEVSPIALAGTATADAAATIAQSDGRVPHGAGFIRLNSGGSAGYFVLASAVTLSPEPTAPGSFNDGLDAAAAAIAAVPRR